MIKIMVTVRNRLAVTAKCITALKKHSVLPHQIYIYDNLTNFRIREHFMYYAILYEKNLITQVTFNTADSTYHAFSKASACNVFGLTHEQDPKKDKCNFLVFLDNDIIVTPGWDQVLSDAWADVKKLNYNNIKVIGQLPGGIKNKEVIPNKIAGRTAKIGKLGGSGLWSVRPNFFRDVGFLDISQLVGFDKKHDQMYWQILEKSSGGKSYILGLDFKLGIHVGRMVGSICNRLTSNKGNKNKLELIKFEDAEKRIDSMNFDEFYKLIENDKEMYNDW